MSLTPLADPARLVRPWCWGLLLLIASTGALSAAELQVNEARIRLLPGDLPAAGYFTLANTGDADTTLVDAQSPAFDDVTLHRSINEDGISRMQAVDRLDLAPGERIAFAPGGYHLMLKERAHPLAIGDDIDVTLQFANGQEQRITFRAVSPATQ